MTERLERAADLERAAIPPPEGPPRDPGDATPAGNDLSALVPERVVVALERRRAAWTPIDTVAAWLIAGQLVLLLVIVGRGSLYVDDLRAQGYAYGQPFWHFILDSNGTHFAPLPRVLDWVQSRAFPLEHTPATIVTLLIRLLLGVGFWRVTRRLFGPRAATLIPLALLLFTPALIPATTWYRQSITVLACTVAIVWAIDAQLRWVLYRHRADLVVLVVVTAAGLGCYEKAAAIPVILLGLSLALFAGRQTAVTGAARAGSTAWRAAGAGVLATGAVDAVFLLIYRSGPYDQGGGSLPSALKLLRLGWDTSTRTMIPLLLGGPYHWAFQTQYTGVTKVSTTAVAFCLVIVLLGLGAAALRSPSRVVRALTLLLAWTVPSVVIVAAGRFTQYGMTLVDQARLWSDLVPAFLLVGALAGLPWRVGVAASPTRSMPPADRGAPAEITVPVIAAALAILLVLGGSVLSSLTYAHRWWQNPTGQWIANARASLVNAEPYPRVLATPLPAAVMPSWVSFVFPTDAPLLLLLRPDIRFYDGDGPTSVMNTAGVRSPYFTRVLTETKKAKLCLAPIPVGPATPVTVRLPKPALYAQGAQVEVGLLLAEAAKVDVTVVTAQGKVLTPQRFTNVELPAGPHTVRLPVPYGQTISAVRVALDATKTNCVTGARVWVPYS